MRNRCWLFVLLLGIATAGCTDTDKNTVDVPEEPIDNTLPSLSIQNIPPNYAQVQSGNMVFPIVTGASSSATTGLDGKPVKLASFSIEVTYNREAPITLFRVDTLMRTANPYSYVMPPDTFRFRDRPGIETWRFVLTDTANKQRVLSYAFEVLQDTLSPQLRFLEGTLTNNTNVSRGSNVRLHVEAIKSVNGLPLSDFTIDVKYGKDMPFVPLVARSNINPTRFVFDSTFVVDELAAGRSEWRVRVIDAAGRTDTEIRNHPVL